MIKRFLLATLFCLFATQSFAAVLDVTQPPYNADPTYTTDSCVAIQAWFDDCVAQGARCVIPKGHYKCQSQQLVFDYAPGWWRGTVFQGDGILNSWIDTAGNTSSPAIIHKNSLGTNATSGQAGFYYGSFYDMAFLHDVPAGANKVGSQLGQDNLYDCPNSLNFTNVWWGNTNSANSDGAVTLRMNCMVMSNFYNVVVNGKVGYGDALQIREGAFNTFVGSFSNSRIGVHFTGGISYSNVFINADIENVKYAVVNDSPTARENIFIGGRADVTEPGGFVFYSSAGNARGVFTVDRMDYGTVKPYDAAFLDENNLVGITIKGDYPGNRIGVSTACGGSYTNNYAQPMWAFVWGGSGVSVHMDGISYSATGTFILNPKSTIGFTCSSPPLMYWTALSH